MESGIYGHIWGVALLMTSANSFEAELEQELDVRDLFERHGEGLLRFLRYLGLKESDAEDALQETFLTAHRRRNDFSGNAAGVLRGIALNVARNARRGMARRQKALPSDPDGVATVAPGQVTSVERVQLREKLSALLSTLPDSQREVVILFEIERLSMPEIARTVDCPLATAYSRLRLGRAALRKAFEGGGE